MIHPREWEALDQCFFSILTTPEELTAFLDDPNTGFGNIVSPAILSQLNQAGYLVMTAENTEELSSLQKLALILAQFLKSTGGTHAVLPRTFGLIEFHPPSQT